MPDDHMAEEELDLLQFAARRVAEPRTRIGFKKLEAKLG
jgi:hypothetical protein